MLACFFGSLSANDSQKSFGKGDEWLLLVCTDMVLHDALWKEGFSVDFRAAPERSPLRTAFKQALKYKAFFEKYEKNPTLSVLAHRFCGIVGQESYGESALYAALNPIVEEKFRTFVNQLEASFGDALLSIGEMQVRRGKSKDQNNPSNVVHFCVNGKKLFDFFIPFYTEFRALRYSKKTDQEKIASVEQSLEAVCGEIYTAIASEIAGPPLAPAAAAPPLHRDGVGAKAVCVMS